MARKAVNEFEILKYDRMLYSHLLTSPRKRNMNWKRGYIQRKNTIFTLRKI